MIRHLPEMIRKHGAHCVFAVLLALLFMAIVLGQYQFAIALSLAGIYAEIWNIRTRYLDRSWGPGADR